MHTKNVTTRQGHISKYEIVFPRIFEKKDRRKRVSISILGSIVFALTKTEFS